MFRGYCTTRREHEDGPRYVAKGARIDRLVLSTPLSPCLSLRSYVQTVRTHSDDAITYPFVTSSLYLPIYLCFVYLYHRGDIE